MKTSRNISIGSGSFGQVFLVEKDGKKYAVKRMEIGGKVGIRNDIVREVIFLRDLRESDIVPKLRWVNFSSSHVEVSMDHYEMSLSDYIKKTKTPERIRNLWTVYDFFLNTMGAFFLKNIQHYDMKPGNVVVDIHQHGLVCKVVDFGFASYARGWTDKDRRKAATRWYRAPEFLSSRSPRVAFMCDAWAIGMSLLQYILGEPIWRPRDNETLKECFLMCHTTSDLSNKKILSKLEKGEKVEGGLDVKKYLGDMYERVPRKITKAISDFLQFDPRERARRMYLSKEEFAFSSGTLRNPSTIVEKILAEKLYDSRMKTLEYILKDSGKSRERILEEEKDYLISYINDEGTLSSRT